LSRSRKILALVSILVWISSASAQQKLLTLDELFDPRSKVNFSGSPPTGLRWLKDGAHYLQRQGGGGGRGRGGGRMEGGPGAGLWLKVEALTGKSEPFYDAGKMEAAFAKLPGFPAEQAKRIPQSSFRMNEAQTAALINEARDLFYYEFGSDQAVRLTNDPEEETVEEFSPDARMVSFVRGNNLYVVDLNTHRERALTSEKDPDFLNGRLDWVYQEELYGRGNYKGHWWSPDSIKIAYLRLDERPVHRFTVVDQVPHFQTIEATPYPKAGDPNPKVQLGVVSAAGGPTRWIDISGYEPAQPLISRVAWTPDSRKVAYQIQNRQQTWLDLNFADAADGSSTPAIHETSKAWVEVIDDPKFLKDGSFLWQSERTGFRHLYHYSPEGKLIRQVTEGKWEVRALHGVDEAGGLIYFGGTEHSVLGGQAYCIKLDGSGLTRLTQTDGTHSANFNPQFTLFIDSWSDINTPTQVRLCRSDGSVARLIDENKLEALKQYKLGRPEFVQVKTRDGFPMEAMVLKPPDFDPRRKYPVMMFLYSGPHSHTVRNSWGATTYMWYQLLAQKGYIIWQCDNRTAGGKGMESTWPLYRHFGESELRDIEDGLDWLKRQPYVERARIGVSGWSFGGFMTCYALTHSKSFKIGIAGGSVTDWRLYDTIYTERYMDLPQNNPDGYKASSPLNAAKDLQGKILLVHGMIDDNVHLQNTIQFMYELQKAGKQFELMLYPKSRHGVGDPLLVKHMRTLMTDFILGNL
jgi:dipeptidyl-peptidase-4